MSVRGLNPGLRGAVFSLPALNPLTILGPAQVAFWGDTFRFIPGTFPDMETLLDLTFHGRSPTQAVPTQQPHERGDITAGKNWADMSGAANQRWQITGASPFWLSGAPTVTTWCGFKCDSFDSTRTVFDIHNSVAGNTGLSLRKIGGGGLRARLITSVGGLMTLDYPAFSSTSKTVIEQRYDGVDYKIFENLVQKASLPKTGTLSNTCTGLTVGGEFPSGSKWNDAFKNLVIFPGIPTLAQRTQMNTYMQASL